MARRNVLPSFVAADDRGGQAGTRPLLGRQEMIIALLHPGCARCRDVVEALARRAGEISGCGAAELVVFLGPLPAGEQSPLPCVRADDALARDLRQALQLQPGDARVLVADRYGAVYAMTPAHEGEPDALIGGALDEIEYIQTECPECGVSEWDATRPAG